MRIEIENIDWISSPHQHTLFSGTENLVEELRIRAAIHLILNQRESQDISILHNWHLTSPVIAGCFEDEVKECLVGWITPFSWHAVAMVINCPIFIWQPKISNNAIIVFQQPPNGRFNPWASVKDAMEVLRVNSSGSLSENLNHYVLLKSRPAPPLITLEHEETREDCQTDDKEVLRVEFLQTTKGCPIATFNDGYYYIRHRMTGMEPGKIWAYRCVKCNKKKCRARIKIQENGLLVSQATDTATHNHEPDLDERKRYLTVSSSTLL